jgi:hypothetical protein
MKGKDTEADSIGEAMERNRLDVEKKVALTGGVTVSATHHERKLRQHRARARLAGLGPRWGSGERHARRRPTRGEATDRGDGGLAG